MNKLEAKQSLKHLIWFLEFKASKAKMPGGRFRNRLERRLVRKLKREFNKQMMWLLREVEKLPSFQQSASVKMYTKKEINEEAMFLLEELPFVEEIADHLILESGVSMLKGGKTQVKKLKFAASAGVTFSLNHPDAIAYLEELRELQLSNYRGSINRTTKKVIRKLLVDGANDGLSYTEIAKQITEQGKAGVFSQARGELIASREIGFAYAAGERSVVNEYINKTGATMQKNWLTANDGSVRETHKKNQQDGWIPIDDVFSGTSEMSAPSSDFGCRCVTSYREL